jgi:hypothetical protein
MKPEDKAKVQQALEVFELVQRDAHWTIQKDCRKAEKGLRQLLEAEPEQGHDHALEQALTRLQKRYAELEAKVGAQPEQAVSDERTQDEPVVWFIQYSDSHEFLWYEPETWQVKDALEITPLYTRPQPAAWVGLTDDEVEFFRRVGHAPLNTTRAIEAKLKQKNGGNHG